MPRGTLSRVCAENVAGETHAQAPYGGGEGTWPRPHQQSTEVKDTVEEGTEMGGAVTAESAAADATPETVSRYREPRSLLFFFAHPDDETLGAGVTIAHHVRRGDTVTVVTCTRGERGDVIPERLAHLRDDPVALAAHRDIELRDALRALGVTRHAYLGSAEARAAGKAVRMYRDSGMELAETGRPRLPANLDSESLCAAPIDEVATDIAAVIDQVRPDVIVTENAVGGYGHPDHIRVHGAVLQALALTDDDVLPRGVFVIERPAGVAKASAAEVTAAGTFTPIPATAPYVVRDVDIDVIVHDPVAREAKEQALRAHGTQVVVTDGQVGHSDGRGEPISATEYFREISGGVTRPGRAPADDFIEGWNIVIVGENGELVDQSTGAVLGRPVNRGRDVLAAIVFLIGGIALGAVAAVTHRSTITLDNVDIPVGFVVTLIALIAVPLTIRFHTLSRIPVSFLTIGALAAIGLLTLEGPGGSVIFPAVNVVSVNGTLQAVNNVASLVWLGIAALSLTVVAIWPRTIGPRLVAERR